MTIELVLGMIGIAGAILTAGRVIFSTESDVKGAVKSIEALQSKCLPIEVSSSRIDFLGHAVEELKGKAQAMDAIANEGKTAHFRLAERVEALAEVVATKATAESVVNIKESVDRLSQDIRSGFAKLNERLDQYPPPPPPRNKR